MHKKTKVSYAILAITLCVLFVSQWQVINSLIHKWFESGTYAHGFIIFPISAYIIYTKRLGLLSIEPNPYVPGFFMLLILSACQIVFNAASVVVLEEFTFIAMIHAVVLGVLGKQSYKYLLFPLMYLLFAVPFGHFMITTLQDITANVAAFALKMTGFTIFHDKWYISTTRGDFEVAAACSGVRYLIASIALCTIFSYYAYQSFKKRLYFILLSIVLPIVANVIRAYFIIVLAHVTYMKMAVGIDHLIYGWLFFGLLIFMLFWIGIKYSDPQPAASVLVNTSSFKTSRPNSWQFAMIIPLMALIVANHSSKSDTVLTASNHDIQWQAKGWQLVENEHVTWSPLYQGALQSKQLRFSHPNKGYIDVYVGLYGYPEQGKEAVSSLNLPFNKKQWLLSYAESQTYHINGQRYVVQEQQLTNQIEHQLVWQWYEILGVKTAHPAVAKGLEVFNMLSRSNQPALAILIGTPYQLDPEIARKRIVDFISDASLSITQSDHS
jgi:exosortase A